MKRLFRETPLLKYIAGLSVFILVVHYIATFNFLYYRFNWLDIPMHMLSGFTAGLIFAYIFSERTNAMDFGKNFWVTLTFILGGALFVGVFWEFYEFFLSQIAPHLFPSLLDVGHMELADTLKDILDDMLGGTVAALFVYFRSSRR